MIEKVIDIQDEIENLIHKNEETYKINPNRIISDFRGEKQTTNDYRGRQLLELLQNADDAKTNKIGIHLDTENKILSVANNGDKFDLNGIQSLLIANLSSKHKKEFIGNKGLGFRSILNWTSEINIKTKDFTLTFSPALAKQRFLEFFPDAQARKTVLEQNQKYLDKAEVPFAILALPEHKDGNSNQKWETIIELKYHEKYEDEIVKQLEAISPKILLFLNHTNAIEISGIEHLNARFTRHFLNEDKSEIRVNDSTWHIFDSGELKFPDSDEKFYQFKIAWQDDLSDEDSTFFTYFPTEVSTQLPFLIHATFELNQSRNDLLKGDVNQFLLEEIAKAIGEIAVTRMRNMGESDWKAFQFLEPLNYNSNPKLNAFFEKLLQLKTELEIYPCVDGSYCILEEAVFYNDEFSNWVRRNKVEQSFTDLLIPLEDNELPDENFRYYTYEGWLEIINQINNKIENLHERALLISLLTGYKFREIHHSKTKLPLLINTTGAVIPEKKQAFMLSKEDIEQYKIPKYVDISFMSGDLYNELLKVLEEDIEYSRIEKEHRSRPLKRVIGEVVNIGSNDITDVIRNIVTTSDREMKEAIGDVRNDIVIGLVESLFSIYQVNPDRRNSINLNITLLNKNLDLCSARDLYLGSEYDLGKTTSIIFRDIFTDKDFVAGNEFWQLEEGGYEYLENFFGWLGVNRLSKTQTKSEYLKRDQEDGYTIFVFDNVGWPDNNSHKNYTALELSDFTKISSNPNFSLENLIAWVISDSKIWGQLNFDNGDSFSHSFHNKLTPVNYKPSYIYYQLKELYLNKQNTKIIVDLDFATELELNAIDFEHPIFKELSIEEHDIIEVLDKLDISISFNDLELEEVYNLIQKLSKVDIEGKNARKLYNLAFNYFKTKTEVDFSQYSKKYKLFAKRKVKKEYIAVDEVYYSDNATLPSKIAEEFWMLDFPKRMGESQISRFFGVKTFKDVEIRIQEESIKISNAYQDFQAWFKQIKPYILTYRLRSINKSIEKTEADELKRAEITLVSALKYTIKVGEEKMLLAGEFLPKSNDKGYYLCVEKNTTLDTIKDTPKVCEAFAEILCTIFKVNDHKDDYRAIFKDKHSLKDTKYLIDVKSLNELYKTALNLLGISNEEISFWAKIYDFKELTLPNTIKDTNELNNLVLKDLGFDLSHYQTNIDYQSLDNQESVQFLKAINNELDVPLSTIFESNSNGLLNFHLHNFETIIYDHKKYFNSSLWSYLKKNKNKQKHLISFQEDYEYLSESQEILDKLYESRFLLEVDYLEILKNVVKRNFDFELKKDETNIIVIQPEYVKLLKENNMSEVDIDDVELRSLLYFEGNRAVLKEYLKVDEHDNSSKPEDNPKEKLTEKLIFSKTEKVVPKSSKSSKGKRGGWNHGDKDIKRNKQAGKEAEERVFNALRESDEVINVEWVSSFSNTSDKSDNKHYDIRYKPVNSNNWKYLEVKAFNGSYFHLSKSEKEEAIKRGKDFEIALVMGEEIHILRDYFKKGIDFDNNDLFYASPADYIITLKIKKEK